MTAMQQNLSVGDWAVVVDGYQGWRRDSAAGDGITSASMILVTRCLTRGEAESLASDLTKAQPHVMPGDQDVPTFAARPYRRSDLVSWQDSQNPPRYQRVRIMPCDADHIHRGLILQGAMK
jgi:hypothetical protein